MKRQKEHDLSQIVEEEIPAEDRAPQEEGTTFVASMETEQLVEGPSAGPFAETQEAPAADASTANGT